jgi:hypothetical protein
MSDTCWKLGAETIQTATILEADLILLGHSEGSLSSDKDKKFCEELKTSIFKMIPFWDIAQCSLVEVD